jgi:hypothetical protein
MPSRKLKEAEQERTESGRLGTERDRKRSFNRWRAIQEEQRANSNSRRIAEHWATKKSTPNWILVSATNETSRGTNELTPENELRAKTENLSGIQRPGHCLLTAGPKLVSVLMNL